MSVMKIIMRYVSYSETVRWYFVTRLVTVKQSRDIFGDHTTLITLQLDD